MAHILAEAEANRVDNTLVDVKPEALIDKLAVTLLEAEPDTLGDKKGDVGDKALVVSVDDNLPEAEAKTH